MKANLHVSRSLTDVEKRCSQVPSPSPSLSSLRNFHSYIYERNSRLLTDYKSLRAIFESTKGIPVCTANRLQRWALFLISCGFAHEYSAVSGFDTLSPCHAWRLRSGIRRTCSHSCNRDGRHWSYSLYPLMQPQLQPKKTVDAILWTARSGHKLKISASDFHNEICFIVLVQGNQTSFPCKQKYEKIALYKYAVLLFIRYRRYAPNSWTVSKSSTAMNECGGTNASTTDLWIET